MRRTILLIAFLITLVLGSTDTLAQSALVDEARTGQEATETVEEYRITAAYPNPFNPQTQFTIKLQEPQHVTVEVFNLLGHRVAQLHDGLLTADQAHAFTFEAGDLPSGLYLIRVAGEDFVNTQRVTLLK